MAVAPDMPPPLHVPPATSVGPAALDDGAADWLRRFHDGDRRVLEECYRRHFATADRATRNLLGTDERETVIHELFSRLIGTPELRRSFRGGSFPGWIATVARNMAIDQRRRLGREVPSEIASDDESAAAPAVENWEESTQARMLVERFRREKLPPEWQGVFEARFLHQLPQREAAQRLGIQRTTLAYRELRIRRLFTSFLRDEPINEGDSK